jgi:hypothetical protein
MERTLRHGRGIFNHPFNLIFNPQKSSREIVNELCSFYLKKTAEMEGQKLASPTVYKLMVKETFVLDFCLWLSVMGPSKPLIQHLNAFWIWLRIWGNIHNFFFYSPQWLTEDNEYPVWLRIATPCILYGVDIPHIIYYGESRLPASFMVRGYGSIYLQRNQNLTSRSINPCSEGKMSL